MGWEWNTPRLRRWDLFGVRCQKRKNCCISKSTDAYCTLLLLDPSSSFPHPLASSQSWILLFYVHNIVHNHDALGTRFTSN
jgi:hypothetical protein